MTMHRRRLVVTVARYAFLGFWALVCLLPMLLIVSTALHDPHVATGNPFNLFSTVRPENLADAWTLGRFGRYFLNTVVIVVPVVVGVIVLSTMTGYALAQFDFVGRTALFMLFVLGLMVPFFALMIPLYFTIRDWGLLNNPLAVILPAIAGAGGTGLPLGVFLMRAFFLDVPRELGDAARVDGCDELGVFRKIMVPLAVPGTAALAVLSFLSAWNTFLLPLLFLPGSDNSTIASALVIFSGGRSRELELIASAALIMIAPVVLCFLLFQRQFIRSLTAGAMKG